MAPLMSRWAPRGRVMMVLAEAADGAETAPELTTGGAAASAADGQSPATPPLELGPYSSVEWERQQAVRRRAGQSMLR